MVQKERQRRGAPRARWYNPPVDSPSVDSSWNVFLSKHPEAHILQTPQWGELKSEFGWQVAHVVAAPAGAQVLLRRLPGGLKLGYIPRGPVGEISAEVIEQADRICRQRGAIALKVEPDEPDSDAVRERMHGLGFRPSTHTIQPHRTLIVDLTPDEDEVLMAMHQKTRYNIRLSHRKGVSVRPWRDPAGFGDMIARTAAREGFGAHAQRYYQRAYELFHARGNCELFLAEYQGTPLASLMVFAYGSRAWYLYGASTTRERNRMPAYQLQWEAMRWAKARGCHTYDLWGVPDADHERLEAEFTSRTDGLWGVYRFKRGFGGQLMRSAGAWDRPYKRPLYWLYRRFTGLLSGR
jgi:peptidoglycan pentaglycine glycine transferase (the first glycine)